MEERCILALAAVMVIGIIVMTIAAVQSGNDLKVEAVKACYAAGRTDCQRWND